MDDPLDSKLCHCRDCQKLHGAPFEWVSIFIKTDARFLSGLDHLYFWLDELGLGFEAEERDKFETEEVKSCNNGFDIFTFSCISNMHHIMCSKF